MATLYGGVNPISTYSAVEQADATSLRLGVRVVPAVNGTVDGVYFYKASASGGSSHVAYIHRDDGALLARRAFSGETSSGWQYMAFLTPVPVSAGVTYNISVYFPAGYWTSKASFFTSDLVVGNLTVPGAGGALNNVYDVVTHANKLYSPTNEFNDQSYFIDLEFTSGGSGETSYQTFFNERDITVTYDGVEVGDSDHVALGTLYHFVEDGNITHVGFYKASTNPGSSRTVYIYEYGNTTALASKSTSGLETSSGWQWIELTTPVTITIGTQYYAVVTYPSGKWMSEANIFIKDFSNRDIRSDKDTFNGGSRNNGAYIYNGTGGFPYPNGQGGCYFIDIKFSTSTGTGYNVSVGGSLTLSGSINRGVGKSTGGSISGAGTIARGVGKRPSGSLTAAGNIVRGIGKFPSGLLVPQGNVNRGFAKSLTGSLTFEGAINRGVGKSTGGSITPQGSISKGVGKLVSGSLAAVGTISRGIGKRVSGVLSLYGTLDNGHIEGGTPLRRTFNILARVWRFTITRTRIYSITEDNMTNEITKRVDEKLDYLFNYDDWLQEGEIITDSSWEVPVDSELTVEAETAFTTTTATLWLAEGVASKARWEAVNTIETSQGRTAQTILIVNIRGS